MIIADTDVLIDFLRGQGACARVAKEIESGGLATTTISRFELLSGARTQRQQEAISDLIAALAVLPFDEHGADLAAMARLDLERQGQRIGMADLMIAAITLAHEGRHLQAGGSPGKSRPKNQTSFEEARRRKEAP